MILYSRSPKETREIASDLAAKIKSGIIALEGELGAGKTTFIQAFVKALGVSAKVKSPTFNIMKKYKIPNAPRSTLHAPRLVYHIDCYRLRDHKDAILIGIKEIFKEPDGIILIEWPERIKKIIPRKAVVVHIDHIDKNKRKILISNG